MYLESPNYFIISLNYFLYREITASHQTPFLPGPFLGE
jgi:hypothetical protein